MRAERGGGSGGVTVRSLVFTPSEMGTRGTRDGSGAEEGWDLT